MRAFLGRVLDDNAIDPFWILDRHGTPRCRFLWLTGDMFDKLLGSRILFHDFSIRSFEGRAGEEMQDAIFLRVSRCGCAWPWNTAAGLYAGDRERTRLHRDVFRCRAHRDGAKRGGFAPKCRSGSPAG